MKLINSNSEVIEKIQNNKMTILYFSGASCGACDVIKEKVETVLDNYPNIESLEINGAVHTDIAAEYSVFSLPVLILFVEGREAIRVGRYFDIMDFHNKINRYYEMLFN